MSRKRIPIGPEISIIGRPSDVTRAWAYDHTPDFPMLEAAIERAKYKARIREEKDAAPRAEGVRITLATATREQVVSALHKVRG